MGHGAFVADPGRVVPFCSWKLSSPIWIFCAIRFLRVIPILAESPGTAAQSKTRLAEANIAETALAGLFLGGVRHLIQPKPFQDVSSICGNVQVCRVPNLI